MTNELVIDCHGILVGEQHIFGKLVVKRDAIRHTKFHKALDRQKIKKAVTEFFVKSVYKGMECVDVVASIGTYHVEVGNIKANIQE